MILLGIVFLAAERTPSSAVPLWVSLLSIAVALLTAVYAAWSQRRTRPIEREELDLDTLAEYREAAEAELSRLRSDINAVRQRREELEQQAEEQKKSITSLQEEHKQVCTQLEKLQQISDKQAQRLIDFEDRLFEYRAMVSMLTMQRNELIRRFEIPTSLADLPQDTP